MIDQPAADTNARMVRVPPHERTHRRIRRIPWV
jgi:hypothetical protein